MVSGMYIILVTCALSKMEENLLKYHVLTNVTQDVVLLLVLMRFCVQEHHCWLWL